MARAARQIAKMGRALAALVLSLALFVATAAAGHRYFFCAEMSQASWAACCPTHDDTRDDAPAIAGDDDCCEARVLTHAGSGVTPEPRVDVRAPLVAVVAPLPPLVVSDARTITPPWHAARAGPPARDARAYRTFLNVSLS